MRLMLLVAVGVLIGGLMLDSALILKRYGKADFIGNMFTDRNTLIGLPVFGAEPIKKSEFVRVKGKGTAECKRIYGVNFIDNRVAKCTVDHWEQVR